METLNDQVRIPACLLGAWRRWWWEVVFSGGCMKKTWR